MATLLMRLAGPMQSWGGDVKFGRRMTERQPTKSGVLGLVASALGRRRDDDISDLSQLRFGVRIDQPGKLLRDYHTIQWEGGKYSNKFSDISERYYLSDAVFLAGLEGDEELLKKIDVALAKPVFPLYLGRRSCPPEGQISLGMRPGCLEDSIRGEGWQASEWYRSKSASMVYLEVIEDSDNGAILSRDLPLSFSQKHRKYTFRTSSDDVEAVKIDNMESRQITDHDAMATLRGGR